VPDSSEQRRAISTRGHRNILRFLNLHKSLDCCWCPPDWILSSVFSSAIEKRKNENTRTTILHVGLHGCKTLSLTTGEGHTLRVSENRVLRRLLRPKRNEVTRGWRKLHNEELRDLYSSPSTIIMIKSRMRWVEQEWRRRGTRIGFRRKARGEETTSKTKT
jgi:hypothetical protein